MRYFAKMKKIEPHFRAQHGLPIEKQNKDPNRRFIRKGKIDGWREELSREQQKLIETKFSDAMAKVGYEPEL